MTGFQMDLPECVRRVEGVGGLPALAVDGPRSSGVVELHGGQVTSFVPRDGEEMLWMSPLAEAVRGKAIRGGVPICFPWFGAGPQGDRTPSHGLARLTRWRVKGVESGPEAVAVTLVLTPDAVASLEGGNQWPTDTYLELCATFGDSLTLELRVRNESADDVTIEAALHTYLAVGDVRQVRVSGLEGSEVLDQVSGESAHVQTDITFGQEVDLVVTAPERVIEVEDAGGGAVTISRTAMPQAVVWNPAPDKTARLADVPDDAWPGFVCVEAATMRGDAVVVPAGEIHTMRATYAPRR